MDDLQDALHGIERPPAPDLGRESLDAEVGPILTLRRIRRNTRRVLTVVAFVLLLPTVSLFSPVLLSRLPQPVLVKSAQIRNTLPRLGPQVMLETIPWPFEKQVEDTDVFVQGHIESLDFVQEDLAKQVTIICPPSEHIRTTVRLRVSRSYPEIASETVTFHTRVSVEGLDNLYMGGEYIVPLALRDDEYGRPSRAHLFRIDPETGRIPGIMDYGRNLTVDEAWKIIRDVYDAVHNNDQVSEGTINEWKELLRSGTPAQCLSAMTYLRTMPDVKLSPAEIVTAIERLYPVEEEISVDERSEYLHMVQAALDMLLSFADSDCVERLFSLYVQDRDRRSPVFDQRGPLENRFIELFLTVPGTVRRERMVKLLDETSQIVEGPNSWQHDYVSDEHIVFDVMAETPGADIDALFLEIQNEPAVFGIESIHDLGNLWSAMGRRGMTELRPTLNAALERPQEVVRNLAWPTDPARVIESAQRAMDELNRNLPRTQNDFELLLAQYDAGDEDLIHEIRRRFPKDGRPYIDWLRTAPICTVADLIAHNAPDPSFVSLLTAELDARTIPTLNSDGAYQHRIRYREPVLLLFALHECGAKEGAVRRLLDLLESAPTDGSPQATVGQPNWDLHQFRYRTELLKLAAYFADDAAYTVVASYLDGAAIKRYYDMPAPNGEFEGVSRDAAHLHVAAIIAAAKTGRERAIPVLQKQFETGTLSFQLVAALALLYVGNHDGDAFLKSWVDHEEGYRTYLRILTHDWNDMLPTVPPESLLRSPEIDALYLDLLRQSEYFGYAPQLVVKCGLAKDRPKDVLPILVDLLSNRDGNLRSNAHEGLRRLTGQDFGYDPEELVTHQQDAIAKWRAYIDTSIHRDDAHPTTK